MREARHHGKATQQAGQMELVVLAVCCPVRQCSLAASLQSIGDYMLPGYTAFYMVILNLFVAMVLTPVFNKISARQERFDETAAADYVA